MTRQHPLINGKVEGVVAASKSASSDALSSLPDSINLASESVAGEEDPGASLDMSGTINPGDEAPAGTPGTGENICRACGGSGRVGEASCPACDGSGKVTVGVGGA